MTANTCSLGNPAVQQARQCVRALQVSWIRGFAPRLYRRFALVQGARLTKIELIAFLRLVLSWQQVEQRLTHFNRKVRHNRSQSKNSGQRNLVDHNDGPDMTIIPNGQSLTG